MMPPLISCIVLSLYYIWYRELAAVHKKNAETDMLTDAIMYEAISQSPSSALHIIDKLTPCMWTELLNRDRTMIQYMPARLNSIHDVSNIPSK